MLLYGNLGAEFLFDSGEQLLETFLRFGDFFALGIDNLNFFFEKAAFLDDLCVKCVNEAVFLGDLRIERVDNFVLLTDMVVQAADLAVPLLDLLAECRDGTGLFGNFAVEHVDGVCAFGEFAVEHIELGTHFVEGFVLCGGLVGSCVQGGLAVHEVFIGCVK